MFILDPKPGTGEHADRGMAEICRRQPGRYRLLVILMMSWYRLLDVLSTIWYQWRVVLRWVRLLQRLLQRLV